MSTISQNRFSDLAIIHIENDIEVDNVLKKINDRNNKKIKLDKNIDS